MIGVVELRLKELELVNAVGIVGLLVRESTWDGDRGIVGGDRVEFAGHGGAFGVFMGFGNAGVWGRAGVCSRLI